jgi:hypothetical protein
MVRMVEGKGGLLCLLGFQTENMLQAACFRSVPNEGLKATSSPTPSPSSLQKHRMGVEVERAEENQPKSTLVKHTTLQFPVLAQLRAPKTDGRSTAAPPSRAGAHALSTTLPEQASASSHMNRNSPEEQTVC